MSIGVLQNTMKMRRGERVRRTIKVTSAGALKSWTGYTFQMHFRESEGAPAPVFALSSEDGISVGGIDDTEITFEISVTRTQAASPCRGVFDLRYWLQPDKSDAEFLIRGRFELEQAVSRDVG